ncbi:hypothetical protein ACV1C6_20245, partial [Aeromonas sanarellii]
MATTTDGGTVTSFSNTTQAKDDSFSSALINGVSGSLITEDFAGIVYLDVMANDLGGNAKTLWSLDDGISSSTSTKLYAPTDLLTQDTARYESISTDTIDGRPGLPSPQSMKVSQVEIAAIDP